VLCGRHCDKKWGQGKVWVWVWVWYAKSSGGKRSDANKDRVYIGNNYCGLSTTVGTPRSTLPVRIHARRSDQEGRAWPQLVRCAPYPSTCP
jgi:hypothetical protein